MEKTVKTFGVITCAVICAAAIAFGMSGAPTCVTVTAVSGETAATAAIEHADDIVETGAKESLGKLEILMYHNVVPDGGKNGDYVIRIGDLRKDMKYLTDNGYTVISAARLADCVREGTKLPPKSVMLTFDDGYLYNKTLAVPLLDEFGYSAVFAVVGEYTALGKSNPNVGKTFRYLEWEEIEEMAHSAAVEIANHSFGLHHLSARKGVSRKSGESPEAYRSMFKSDTLSMEVKLGGAMGGVKVYAYPFGYFCAESEATLKELGYNITLTCYEGVNDIKGVDSLFLLKRYNRSGKKSGLDNILPSAKIARTGA